MLLYSPFRFLLAIIWMSYTIFSTKFLPEHLVSMPRPYYFTPSVDGSTVIYSTTNYNITTNKKTTLFHLLEVETNKIQDITNITTSDFEPLSYIDDRLLFTSYRNGYPNLYSISLKLGKQSIKQHTNFTYDEFNAVKVSKNKLVFSTPIAIKHFNKDNSNVLSYEDTNIRNWDTWYNYKNQHIHIVDFNMDDMATTAIDLLQNQPNLESPMRPFYESNNVVLSNDANWIAFISLPNDKYKGLKNVNELYLISTDNNQLQLISQPGKGIISSPKFSSDNQYLYYIQTQNPINASSETKIIQYNIQNKTYKVIGNEIDLYLTEIFLSKDNLSLYFSAYHFGYNKLFSYNMLTHKLSIITDTGNSNYLYEYKDGLLITQNSATNPNEIYKINIDGKNKKLISNINYEYLKQFQFNSYTPFYFNGVNNDLVQGFIIKPPNFNATKKYPIMLWSHGGPEQPFGDDWSNRWNYQIPVSSNYILISINFHGSYGVSNNFTQSILGHWNLAIEDILLGLNYCLNKYDYLNKDKMVAWGASFGGYVINLLNGKTNLFKALVSHAGIFDLTSIHYTTDNLATMVAENGGELTDLSILLKVYKNSPSTYINNWKTPTLVIHGKNDFTTPEAESIATYQALLKNKVPTKLLYFPDESHWVVKNANSLRWMKETLAWSNKWINHTSNL